jgi:AAA+ ATPase superfamily predicted ATPase
MKFIGRQRELEGLNILLKKSSASLVVIRGRRRIGKSRLISEFTKDKNCWDFSGLTPAKGITNERQLNAFADRMSKLLKMPKLRPTGWDDLFWHLGNHVKKQKLVIVFDEISWMGSLDPDFLGHLKNLWDLYLSHNPNLIFILCGSVSSWIEENILSHTGFLGRVSVDMVLEELSLQECQAFWKDQKKRISAYEKFKVLSVTGGIPKYLEEIIPEEPAEANIKRLCFQPEGLLFREFNQIFSDLFEKKAPIYSSIVSTLAHRSLSLDEICQALNIKKGGAISKYMHHLTLAGFVSKESTWNLKTKRTSKLKHFRLSDNYLRFYVRYIQPNEDIILKKLFVSKTLSGLPGWETIMGFQFENLVLNNLKEVYKLLKIDTQDITAVGPFFQRPTQRKKGCQIDLLIQTSYQTLYLCEIKFHGSELNKSVVNEVEEKMKRISIPQGYSIRPVLIHVNGVSQSVIESGLFSHVIDFSEFFQ